MTNLTLNLVLKWTGVITGIAGAILLSFGNDLSRYGWVMWVPSNLSLIWLFYRSPEMSGLPIMYIIYLLTTFNGISNSFG